MALFLYIRICGGNANMHTEGEFNYTNGSLINSRLDMSRIASVSRHEAQHAELYSITTFGQLILMLEKNSLFHDKSNWMYKGLFNYVNRMQERIAVNIEEMDILSSKGKSQYEKSIEDLKNRNRTYYNYFRKMCCINGKVQDEEDAQIAIQLFRTIGHIALNVRIDEIPLEKMTSEKEIKDFFSNQENAKKYSPNKRFDIIVNKLFRDNENDDFLDEVMAATIDLEKEDNLPCVHNMCVKKMEKILSDSIMYERLIKRIETVGTIQLNLPCKNPEYLMNLPLDLDSQKSLNIKLLDTFNFNSLINTAEYKDMPIFLLSAGGFEDFHFIEAFNKNNDTAYVTCIFDEEQFLKIISNIEQYLVFVQTKLFRNLKSRIRGIAQQLPIYIIAENSIYHSIEFISKNFKRGNYSFINKRGYVIVVIWRKSYIFLGYIIEIAKPDLKTVLKEYEIEYIEPNMADIDIEYVNLIAETQWEKMNLSKKSLDNRKI